MPTKPNNELSRAHYFWLWLTALGVGGGLPALAHTVTRRLHDSGSTSNSATAGVILMVAFALAVASRSVHVIVTSAFSDAYRVFRARHLFACSTLLLTAGTLTAYAVVVRDPFRQAFAYGRITGLDIVDVGTVIAALVCLVGAGLALTGAWDASLEERNWHRTLHLRSRRRI
jgi:hypothetical protein